MAKTTLTFEDLESGGVDVIIDSDQPLDKDICPDSPLSFVLAKFALMEVRNVMKKLNVKEIVINE